MAAFPEKDKASSGEHMVCADSQERTTTSECKWLEGRQAGETDLHSPYQIYRQ